MEFQVLSYNISLNKQMMLEIDAPEGDKKKTQMAFVGEWEIVCHGKNAPRGYAEQLTIIGVKPGITVPEQLYTSASISTVFVNSAMYAACIDMLRSGNRVFAVINKSEPSYIRIKETAIAAPIS